MNDGSLVAIHRSMFSNTNHHSDQYSIQQVKIEKPLLCLEECFHMNYIQQQKTSYR